MKSNDPTRVTRVTIHLKDLFFAKSGPLFVWEKFPKLRSPMEFAELRYFGLAFNKDEIAAGFFKHTTSPLHASLTELEGKDEKVFCSSLTSTSIIFFLFLHFSWR